MDGAISKFERPPPRPVRLRLQALRSMVNVLALVLAMVLQWCSGLVVQLQITVHAPHDKDVSVRKLKSAARLI